jgi:hypothetical protein
VKGLDYALLEKTRKQKEREDELARASEEAKAQAELTLDQIEPSTPLGATVLRALRKVQLLEHSAVLQQAAGSILQRTVYDFDTRPESEVDVPLLVTRSKTVSMRAKCLTYYMLTISPIRWRVVDVVVCCCCCSTTFHFERSQSPIKSLCLTPH